jgi:predicted dehydrogenase
MKKVRWGIISTANIGVEKVIPAMQAGQLCEIVAISSRNEENAKAAADKLHIPMYFGSYEAMLASPDIDAVYNPLPNHLHVPYTIKALEQNKHVLCEKPLGMSAKEVEDLIKVAATKPHLKVMEAFMYRLHPQWQKTKELVTEGAIGKVQNIHSVFTYFNTDPTNVRNQKDIGGGGLMDIGCYSISLSRFLYGSEPISALATADFDPTFGTDRLVNGILEFANGTATFTCSMQAAPSQRVSILGTDGRIEMETPFYPVDDKPTQVVLINKEGEKVYTFDKINHYTLQCDAFSKAIIDNTPVPTNITDAYHNMVVIEKIFESAAAGKKVLL